MLWAQATTEDYIRAEIKTIIWCCFAAGVDAAVLEIEQKKKNGLHLNQP